LRFLLNAVNAVVRFADLCGKPLPLDAGREREVVPMNVAVLAATALSHSANHKVVQASYSLFPFTVVECA
jgi:hypothetical protein